MRVVGRQLRAVVHALYVGRRSGTSASAPLTPRLAGKAVAPVWSNAAAAFSDLLWWNASKSTAQVHDDERLPAAGVEFLDLDCVALPGARLGCCHAATCRASLTAAWHRRVRSHWARSWIPDDRV